jgi:transaldolase
MKIKVFYDGSKVDEYCNFKDVVGVTTNISFLKKAKVKNYKEFAKKAIESVDGKPISFQVFNDDPIALEKQAREITSWGDNVYVKIPVVLPNGKSTVTLIKRLAEEGLRINITSVYTKEQIKEIYNANIKNIKTLIVSVFCGRINDTGADAIGIIKFANSLFENDATKETLWAGCQRVRDILDAEKCGTDIITVPEDFLKKINRVGLDLHNFSVKTSTDFFADGSEMYIDY